MTNHSANSIEDNSTSNADAVKGCGCLILALALVMWCYLLLFMPSSSSRVDSPDDAVNENSPSDEIHQPVTMHGSQATTDDRREAVASTEQKPKPNQVTRKNYEKIDQSTFYIQALVILGYSPEKVEDITVGDTRSETYIWRSRKGGYILVEFWNGNFHVQDISGTT
ncbi:hypothetical protein [Rosistilla oblonga]|uniref:hypothetical protein n=1 Tax=Rosistilla oblonga TaxID=2527990 RepID=UPI003A97E04C